MEEKYEIERSPLCQKITRDGTTVEVEIYRGKGDTVWVLEVVDEEGASTVWQEPFDTDRAALDEVLATIEKEGIDSFMRPDSSRLH